MAELAVRSVPRHVDDLRLLVETYETERVKIISTWSEFRDEECIADRAAAIPAVVAFRNRWCISVEARTCGSGTWLGIDVSARLLPKKRDAAGIREMLRGRQ
jgi:hypothetical protein